MITSWDIYWITRLDYVAPTLITIALISALPTIAFLIGAGLNSGIYKSKTERNFNRAKKTAPLLVFSFIFMLSVSFVPTTKEAIAIYAIPKVLNNEKIQELPDNTLDFINTKLKAWTEETLGEKGIK